MTLFSQDFLSHTFNIDYDGTGAFGSTVGEPLSPAFSSPTIPITYTFTASRTGTFSYWCTFHGSPMTGTWMTQITPPPAGTPAVSITSPQAGDRWTGGSSHTVQWAVGGISGVTYSFWVNYSQGATRTALVSGTTTAATNTTAFSLPRVNATDAKINVTAISGTNAGYAEVTFTIDSSPPTVTSQGQLWITPNGLLAVSLGWSEPMKPLTDTSDLGIKETFTDRWVSSQASWSSANKNLTITFAKPGPEQTGAVSYTIMINTTMTDASDPGNHPTAAWVDYVIYTPPHAPPNIFLSPFVLGTIGVVAAAAVAMLAILLFRRRRHP